MTLCCWNHLSQRKQSINQNLDQVQQKLVNYQECRSDIQRMEWSIQIGQILLQLLHFVGAISTRCHRPKYYY